MALLKRIIRWLVRTCSVQPDVCAREMSRFAKFFSDLLRKN